MIRETIQKAADGFDLTEAEMIETMDEIMSGIATPAQIGAFLMAIRIKGETVEEIAGAARVMRSKCTPIPCGSKGECAEPENGRCIVDTCGTGGDGSQTFNVSTTTAFVVAGGGLKVAKHGNRAVSSRCGSADLIEALGVPLDLTPEQVGECIDRLGIGFLFAPMLHGAMKHAIGPRREIGLRTLFNVLGPLTNPAGADVQVIGVYDRSLTEPIAGVLNRLGCKSAYVVFGHDGYDEITVTGPSQLTRLDRGAVFTETVRPEEFGFPLAKPEDIRGGDTAQNAAITLAVLQGQKGAPRNMVLINAAAAFVVAGKADTLEDGVELAAESIDSGKALAKLNALAALGEKAEATA